MKPNLLSLLLTAATTGTLGWYVGQRTLAPPTPTAPTTRKILYYQSAMHPWIKSDQPGQCTICGMELSPVYEGDRGLDAGDGVVTLGTNSIQVIHVQTHTVQPGPLTRTLRVAGTLESDTTRRRIVSAYVDGRLDRLAVNYVGAEVQAGEPLALFYSPSLLAAEREYAVLHASLAPDADPEGQPLLAAAAQRLQRLGLTPSQIDALATKDPAALHSELLAPLTGTVVERFAFEGQYVQEGDPLFDLADFSVLWFQFDAYEKDLAWLQVGQPVDVTLPSVPGQTFSGPIAFIDPNLKDLTRSAKVRVELPNPMVERNGRARRLLAHQAYADGSVRLETDPVLLVPRSAVLSPGGSPIAYVDRGGGAYEQRPLKLGRLGDHSWEVLDGLSAGEPVVTAGNLLLDAQAQLNSGPSAPTPTTDPAAPAAAAAEAAPAAEPLADSQRTSLRAALERVDTLGDALAADDLATFNRRAADVTAAIQSLDQAFPDPSPLHPLVHPLAEAARLVPSPDLESARQAFHPLSTATVALVRAVRAADPSAVAHLRIIRCPMTRRSFPGAPPQSEWIQSRLPVRNPWYGDAMLDCGTEVK